MTWLLALIFKPIAGLILFGLICLPGRIAVQKWFPEGKLKKLLLYEIPGSKPGFDSGRGVEKPR